MEADVCSRAPSDWPVLAIEEVCHRVTSGGTPSRARPEFFQGGSWPWVKTQELTDSWIEDTEEHITDGAIGASSAKVLPAGTVLLALYGATVGQLGILRREMTCNQACCAMVVSDDRADFRYLFYQLLAARPQLKRLATGAAQQNLSGELIKKFRLPFPSLGEQRAIGEILGALDDKIELNRRMNETLEVMARALFKSWFVDFDPVRAKADSRETGLPQPIANLFPDRFEDSQLGDVPAGWHTTLLVNGLTELETGSRPKGGVSQFNAGIPSVGAESIVGLGLFDYSKTRFVPREFFDAMAKGRVRSRDVLLYKDGGRPGVFEPHLTMFGDGFPFATFGINEHVYRLRARRELGQNFLFFWLSSELALEEMRIKGTGVAIPGLNSTQVKSLPLLVPSIEVTGMFDLLVEPMVAKVLANSAHSRTLVAIRDALLPRLISGEVRIPQAQSMLAAGSV